MARFACPNCNETIELNDGPGATAACPKCGTVVRAPGAVPPPMPTAQPFAPAAPAPKPTRAGGLAIAALIFGIVSVVPVLGILAVVPALILSIIALAKNRPGKGLAIAGLVLAIVGTLMGLLMVAILLPALGRAKQMSETIVCSNRLRSIYTGIVYYNHDHNGACPPDLSVLLAEGLLPGPQALECPTCPSPAGGVGYFYMPPPKPIDLLPSPAATILACDFRGNHGDLGRNVLFADGHRESLREPDFQTRLGDPRNAAFAAALRAAEAP